MENKLDILSHKYNTDKKSSVHNYTETYWSLFKDKQLSVKNFLEIGVLNGSSVNVWNDFFTNANIYAIDINSECKKFERDRIKISIGPQENHDFLKSEFLDKGISFDYIIDDGSHISRHQISSFEFLFDKCLNNGGLYIIEDTCCSYWGSHEGALNKKDTCIEYFKDKVDEINFYGFCKNNVLDRNNTYLLSNYPNPTNFQKQIKSISFLNSLIIIEKQCS
ncbi:MAG: hypothetical protein KatS3mg035_1164 [Bacteroidia bacterium]|nr:MAG: hypothetical protein KatS3mg035_1164 [Bacteroidia bacterium]